MKKIGKILKAPIEKFKGLEKKTKKVVCLVLAVAVALAGFGIWKWYGGSAETSAKASGESIVRRGNLTNSITGSGTVEPIEQREIVPEVRGKILESPFNEGDSVQEGDILYRFEMTAAENAIESAVNSVEKAQTNLSNRQSNLEKVKENISKLTIKATTSGKISGLALRIGEDAQGKICTITNFKEQTATIPFSSAHINKISVGDSVEVAVDKYMINTTGEVIRKYTAPDTLSSGAVVYNVEILIDNKYTLEENVNVTATVKTASGNVDSASYGSIKYADPVTVNADQRGEVTKINFKNGDWVNEGEIIAQLKNKDLNDDLRTAQQSVKEAEMNLTEALNNLEDKEEEANEYIVTSPINGVVLYKDYEVGDTISSQNAPSMMIVADMSKMKFTISADELDISKIQLGQSVSVTADALQGQRLVGNITSISKVGTASNGVTNYPVEVTIDQPGDLMPGMNVNAQIVVEQSYNCLYLPAQAVEYYDGKYYVTVIGEVENMPEPQTFGGQGGFGQGRGGFGQRGAMGEEGQKPEGATQSGENKAEAPTQGGFGQRGGNRQMPEGAAAQTGENKAEAPAQGGFGQRGGNRQMPEGAATQTGENKAEAPAQGGFGQRGGNRQMPEGAAAPGGENKAEAPAAPSQNAAKPEEEKKTEASGQNTTEQGGEKKEQSKQDGEKKEQPAQNGKQSEGKNNSANAGRQGNQRNGNRQEDYKIKYYAKEKRVEVKIGVRTDTSYEILEGVEYGQVVKNTAQATQRGAASGGSRGGFGGMGGGSFGGGSFGGGNNRNWNRSGGMGGRR